MLRRKRLLGEDAGEALSQLTHGGRTEPRDAAVLSEILHQVDILTGARRVRLVEAEGVVPGVNLGVNPSPNAPTAQEMADAPQGKGQSDPLAEAAVAPMTAAPRRDSTQDGEPGA